MERVVANAYDGVQLVGNFYPGNNSSGVLLLHMYRKSKEDWDEFAQKLVTQGFSVLAMDMRGHGESGGSIESISPDKYHETIVQDVGRAVDVLRAHGAKSVFIIGASIGANSALIYGAQKNDVAGVALLSPGLDYRGVDVQYAMKNYRGPLFIAASRDDAYSAQSSQTIFAESPAAESQKQLILYENSGHGTAMFGKESPDLSAELLEWVKTRRA